MFALHDLCDEWLQGFERKPNFVRRANFVACMRVILLNLMRVQTVDNELTVGIPSGNGRLGEDRRYRPAYATVRYFRMALAILLDRGLIQEIAQGYNFAGYAHTSRYALTELACLALPMETLTTKDFTIAPRDEIIILKNTDGQLVKYRDTAETLGMRHRLQKLNVLLEESDIGSSRTPNPLTDFDDDFGGEKKDLYRVFNNGSFDEGGRFYGGWWLHAKKYLRRTITIDGQPTIEADFKGLHPAILFAQRGLCIPPDPYALVPHVFGNESLRRLAKVTFLALLNATGKTSEPRGFDEQAHGMTAEAFRLSVRDAFPMLPGVFGTGIGVRLQREDSDLAERILLHFADRGIVSTHRNLLRLSR